jgi:hypothetical protein
MTEPRGFAILEARRLAEPDDLVKFTLIYDGRFAFIRQQKTPNGGK